MFALGVRYLLGRVVATHPASRERVEWPPHPDRVFMALVAAYAETGQDEQEKMALQWLESLSPPELVAGDFLERSAVTAYVPVNDSAAPRMKAGNDLSADQPARGRPALLPESRPRQPRQFPTASLLDPNETVYLRWHDSCSPEHLAALAALCRKVTYIGHSSSLVQCWLETAQACASLRPQWTPNESSGRIRLRITARGRFEDLLARYEAGLRPVESNRSVWDEENSRGQSQRRPDYRRNGSARSTEPGMP